MTLASDGVNPRYRPTEVGEQREAGEDDEHRATVVHAPPCVYARSVGASPRRDDLVTVQLHRRESCSNLEAMRRVLSRLLRDSVSTCFGEIATRSGTSQTAMIRASRSS